MVDYEIGVKELANGRKGVSFVRCLGSKRDHNNLIPGLEQIINGAGDQLEIDQKMKEYIRHKCKHPKSIDVVCLHITPMNQVDQIQEYS